MKKILFTIAVACSLGGGLLWAQTDATAKPPMLSEVQKLQVQNAVLRFQLAQAQLQDAQREAAALIQSLQVAGWTLDVNSLTYSPAPKPERKPGEQP